MDGGVFYRSNTILYCNRWAETVDFYRRLLGLPVTTDKDWFVEFRVTETSFLSVANERRASIDSAGGQGVTLSLRVQCVKAMHERLSRGGVVPGSVTRHPWGAMSFFCRDPEGYRLEFWEPLEK